MKKLFISLSSLVLLSCSTNVVEETVVVDPYFKKTYYSNEFGTIDSTQFGYLAIEDGIYRTNTDYELKVKIVYSPSDSLLAFTFYEHGEYEAQFEENKFIKLKIENEESINLVSIDNVCYDNKNLTKLLKSTNKDILKCKVYNDYGDYNFTLNVNEFKKILK